MCAVDNLEKAGHSGRDDYFEAQRKYYRERRGKRETEDLTTFLGYNLPWV